MNSDFRLSIGYFKHPKVQKLKRRLGADGVLAHAQLMAFAAQERPSGALTNMDADDIGIACDYGGDIMPFIAALVDLRLLDRSEDGALSLHDWAEHNPWAVTAPARSQKAQNAANVRWGNAEAPPETPTRGKQDAAGRKRATGTTPGTDAQAQSDAQTAMLQDASSINGHYSEHQAALPQASVSNALFPPSPIPSLPSESLPSEANTTTTPPTSPPEPSPAPEPERAAPAGTDTECREVVVASLRALGVSDLTAEELCRRRTCEQIRHQVEWLPHRIREKAGTPKPIRDPAATLVKSIEDGWAVPASYSQAKQREAEQQHRLERSAQRDREAEEREDADRRAEEAGQAALQAAWDDLTEDKREQVKAEATARFRQQFSCHAPALEKAGDPMLMPVGPRRNWEKLRDALLMEPDALLMEPDALLMEPDALLMEPDALLMEQASREEGLGTNH